MHLGRSKCGGIKRFVGQVDRVIKKMVGIVYELWHRMQRKAACGIVHNVRWGTAVSCTVAVSTVLQGGCNHIGEGAEEIQRNMTGSGKLWLMGLFHLDEEDIL